MNTRLAIAGLVTSFVASGGLWAQSYRDFTLVRDRPWRYSTVFEVELGLIGGIASDEDDAIGLEDKYGWDGHAWFHTDKVGDREASMDVYAGRDGAYFGLTEGDLLGQGNQSRLEISARYWPFYREGFYNGDDFIPTGRYEGLDYGAALMVARQVDEGVRFEAGPFYRRMTFDDNSKTEPNYTIPDDYNTYGGRAMLEHATMTLDRVTGRPEQGFILTLAVEREQNDSSRTFGIQGIFESRLPSGVWRGLGHVEFYYPASLTTTWEIKVDAQYTDDDDRVYNFDAQKPVGNLWVDAEVGFRIDIGQALWVTPLGKYQFVRTLDDTGISDDKKSWFGGGLKVGYSFGDSLELLADYSYLSNQYREPVSTSEDTFGEHQFFVGFVTRFGATRRL